MRVRSLRRCAALAATLLVAPCPSIATPQGWIGFPTTPAPGATIDAGTPPHVVRAYFATPDRTDDAPGVVLLHGCGGPRAFHKAWARALSERGFVALVPDSHFSRNRAHACDPEPDTARAERVRDARGALEHLAAQPGVDRRRLAVVGWDDAPLTDLLGPGGVQTAGRDLVGAAVAVSPRCAEYVGSGARTGAIPRLVVGAAGAACSVTPEPAPPRAVADRDPPGRADVAAEPAAWRAPPVAGAAPSNIEHVLPRAPRGFDDPDARQGASGRRYDASAHAAAIDAVERFLVARLSGGAGAATTWRPSATPAPARQDGARWLLDPDDPGPDLPPVGASLFDRIFSAGGPAGIRYAVPYPFAAVLARLHEAHPERAGAAPAWSAVMIPYGRSLQRHAAAPDYAASPRVVVAATGEPGPGAQVDARDRLFVGYQPRSRTLEVISWNEEAGRFEFQVVSDYGPGATARVRYARRAICVSCHQGHAPIFPEAAWDETNANPRVVQRLAALGTHFEGLPINAMGPSAAALDNATDRAGFLASMQPAWREACAAGESGSAARCRAGALLAMIQYRLSAAAGFDTSASLVGEGFAAHLERRWKTLWPTGVLVPSADLPNRNPMLSPDPASIYGPLDPLRPRPAAALWSARDALGPDGLVARLGAALPGDDLERIDRHLAGTAVARGATTSELLARCTFVRRGIAGRPANVRASCTGSAAGGFELEASFSEAGASATGGSVTWLDVGGARYTDLSARGHVDRAAGKVRTVLAIAQAREPSRVRLRDGTAVHELVLERRPTGTRGRSTGVARLVLVDDFAPVADALERMAARSVAGDALDDGPFRARALTAALLDALGAPRGGVRCCDAQPTPAPRLAEDAALSRLATLEHGGPMRTFARYCGHCHAAPGDSPPGFLAGPADAVLASLARCGPRILHRLEAWRLPVDARPLAPMPPPAGLRLAGVSGEDWAGGDALAALRAYVSRGLSDAGLDPAAVLSRPYDEQPRCAPG